MSFWDNLKSTAGQWNDSLKTNIAKYKNEDFSKACMAICALVAASDGTISPEERRKVAGLIMVNETLRVFPVAELQQKFHFYCDKLQQDFDFGKVEVMQDIAKMKKKEDQARAAIQIGIIIGGADGNFDAAEKKMIKEACYAAGMNPVEFDL